MYKDKSYKYAEIYGVICMHICLFIHGVMTRKSCNYTRAILSFRSCCILPRTLLCSYMCVIPGISDAFHAHHRLRVIIQNHHPDLGEHENAPVPCRTLRHSETCSHEHTTLVAEAHTLSGSRWQLFCCT